MIRHWIDGISASAILAAILGWLPAIAAVLAIIWYCIQIYESATGQRIFAWLWAKITSNPSR